MRLRFKYVGQNRHILAQGQTIPPLFWPLTTKLLRHILAFLHVAPAGTDEVILGKPSQISSPLTLTLVLCEPVEKSELRNVYLIAGTESQNLLSIRTARRQQAIRRAFL